MNTVNKPLLCQDACVAPGHGCKCEHIHATSLRTHMLERHEAPQKQTPLMSAVQKARVSDEGPLQMPSCLNNPIRPALTNLKPLVVSKLR